VTNKMNAANEASQHARATKALFLCRLSIFWNMEMRRENGRKKRLHAGIR